MAELLSGKAICDKDGEFDLNGYRLESGEAIFGKLSDLNRNFCGTTKLNGTFYVQA